MNKKLTFFDIIKSENMKSITEMIQIRNNDLDNLFIEWKQQRKDYLTFCEDGILIDDHWDNSRTKILFLLKETFLDFPIIRGDGHGPDGNSKTFWRKMQMWTYLTDKIFHAEEIIYNEALKEKEKKNIKIAYVNIKKNVTKGKAAGKTNSNFEDIKSYAKNDAEFLKKQIDLINPDVIICSGTYDFIKFILPQEELLNNKYNSIWIVKAKHLSNRKSYLSNFTELKDKLTTFLKNP